MKSLLPVALGLTALLAACSGPEPETASSTTPNNPQDTMASDETSSWTAGDTIPSGQEGVPDIQILEVRANGSGPACGTGPSATLAYKAMQADGSVLDPGRRPFTFKVGSGQAIRGWDVVVAQMRVGDDFTILLPQQLAYGPSKGDLKFDMKLQSFQ